MSNDDSLLDQPSASQSAGAQSREERERDAALRRGEERRRERAEGRGSRRAPYAGLAPASIAARAFAVLAENVRDYAVFLLDPDGVITFWGEGARLIEWWTKDQAEGAHLRLLYPPGGSEDGTAEAHLREAAERGEYTGEGHRVRGDGSMFWAGTTLTALRDEEGTLLGFAKVTRDLTARRAADAMLQAAAAAADAARAEAVGASMAKSGFLATMSHEIRTPLNAIIGYLELLHLETDGPLTSGQQRHIGRARASSRHLLELVTDVLDFSRIEAGRMTAARRLLRVGDAVAGALALVAPQARARGLEITDAVSGHVAGLAAYGDEAHVRQILVNLLANAVKFTAPREGEAGRIVVSAGAAARPSSDARTTGDAPWVYVRVEDTGTGIPEDRLESIFEPFVQVDMTLTRPHGGTGLGLAISRRLARLMGGDVTVRSTVGVGSTFFLWLPATPVESLSAGGPQGDGPGDELRASATGETAGERQLAGRSSGVLRAVADSILGSIEVIVDAYVSRLRGDPATPSARTMDEAAIEDHLASFLADLAALLAALEGPAGEPAAAVRDSTAIQRVVAERHGAQRARLGWTEAELVRELEILREELAAAVRREAPSRIPGPSPEARAEAADRALDVIRQLLAVVEGLSVRSYRDAVAAARST